MGKYGRIPSPPDERDFKLEHFLGEEDPLIGLLKTLDKSHAAVATKKILDNLVPRFLAMNPPPRPEPPPPTNRYWTNRQVALDQGNFGTCVGNGYAQWGNTEPIEDAYTETDAREIYYETTVFDGYPDPTGQNGATVRSGAKAMQARGKLQIYAFAESLDTALAWLLTKGSVVVGTDWTYDMENPDADGFVHPTGDVAGGHCYLMVGFDGHDVIRFLNSWGPEWGDNGYFNMHAQEFAALLENRGELCTAVEI